MALSPVRLRASMSVGSADTMAFTRSNSPVLIASIKAALLEVVSGMPRSYLFILFVVFFGFGLTARAGQTPQSQQERPPLGAAVTVGPLGALPAAGNLFALLDTLVPDVIADRIDAGGTGAGSPARVGAHGSTWTQTIYRVGDADITSLSGSGAP